jgi:hypothetical protein
MPEDLDESQVVDWYLQQTRSQEPAPADPRDQLGITAAGFSAWEIVTLPGGNFWASDSVARSDREALGKATGALFRQAHERHEIVDAPIQQRLDRTTDTLTLWLSSPKSLRTAGSDPPTTRARPSTRYLRFYFRGETRQALAHLARITREVEAAGHRLSQEVWITPLSLWPDTATYVAEYRVELSN